MPVFCLVGMLLTAIVEAETPQCASTHFNERQEIDYVIDGDTVILKDRRHVRLIGINTPEIFHDGRPAQPGAHEARDYLQQLLTETPQVGLQYDAERKDRHGRTLAHLFLPNGDNIQALLLEQGLAMPLFIPPSIDLAACYAEVAASARRKALGLWALPAYEARSVTSLSGRETGFHIVQGRVRYVSESRSAIWLNLENNVALRITRPDLEYFDIGALKQLAGRQVEARGWLYRRNEQLRMRIRYPLDFTIINNN